MTLRLRKNSRQQANYSAKAQGLITAREGGSLTRHGYSSWDLTIEVHFPDGSQTQFCQRLTGDELGILEGQIGQVLPVLYDPNDPSSMTVDVASFREQRDRAKQLQQQQVLERSRQAIQAEDASVQPTPGLPSLGIAGSAPQENIALVEKLTKLRQEFNSGQIGAEEYQSRRQAIRSRSIG